MKTETVRVLVITGSWLLISLLLFAFAHYYLMVSVPDARANTAYHAGYNLVGYVAGSLVGGILFGYTMVFRSAKRTRRRRFSYGIVYHTILFLGLYVLAVALVTIPLAVGASPSGASEPIPRVLSGVLTNPASLINMVMWALVVAGTQFMLQVSDKFGQGVLWKFLTGRYFRPKEEDRIFMFLDMAASTTIAEKLGHTRYFEFIREFIADMTQPIVDHGGEIYQYVGDEIVVSWPVRDRVANARCLRCFFAAEDHMNGLGERYLARFGVVPKFKAGLHTGSVMVGEIGIVRKDIVFSGDVLNTTARIQAECNKHEVSLIASSSLLDSLDLDSSLEVVSLGKTRLRGKEDSVEMLAIVRGEPAHSSDPARCRASF